MIKQERDLKQRVVAESGNFICLAPFVSRSPFELWLLPKEHHHDFNSAEPDQLDEIAVLLKQVLGKLTGILKSPPYNFLIHSSPLDADGNQEYYHWHLELMPRLTRVAGFEWGSGFYINPTPPELAAELLRSSSK
jgi:UDPglucose--hexose-1-phosphate uridylyltransferase